MQSEQCQPSRATVPASQSSSAHSTILVASLPAMRKTPQLMKFPGKSTSGRTGGDQWRRPFRNSAKAEVGNPLSPLELTRQILLILTNHCRHLRPRLRREKGGEAQGRLRLRRAAHSCLCRPVDFFSVIIPDTPPIFNQVSNNHNIAVHSLLSRFSTRPLL